MNRWKVEDLCHAWCFYPTLVEVNERFVYNNNNNNVSHWEIHMRSNTFRQNNNYGIVVMRISYMEWKLQPHCWMMILYRCPSFVYKAFCEKNFYFSFNTNVISITSLQRFYCVQNSLKANCIVQILKQNERTNMCFCVLSGNGNCWRSSYWGKCCCATRSGLTRKWIIETSNEESSINWWHRRCRNRGWNRDWWCQRVRIGLVWIQDRNSICN